ncbi:MAG: Ig-like domain-containing protein [Pseudomonadota bacterium]
MQTTTYDRGAGGIFQLTAGQLEELRRVLTAQRDLYGKEGAATNSDLGLGVPIYELIFNFISEIKFSGNVEIVVPKEGVNPAVWRWVQGAMKVNSGLGFYADFIREYTIEQFTLRGGSESDAIKYNQVGSNNIAFNLALDMIANAGTLPSPLGLGAIDAGAAASKVFNHLPDSNADYAPWAGTLLFPFLGIDNFYRDLLLNSERVTANIGFDTATGEAKIIKYTTGTYDLISMLQATRAAAEVASGIGNNSIDAFLNLLNPNVVDSNQDNLIAQTNAFFAKYYELAEGVFTPGDDLLFNRGHAAWDSLTGYKTNYQVGKYGNDNLVIEDSTKKVIMNGGTGDDTLTGGTRDDLLDGDEGKDTLYGKDGNDFLFGGNDNDELNGDAGYDLLVGNQGNDTLKGGAGSDHLYGGNLTFSVVDGIDILDGGEGNDILEGGSGNDTYLFTGNNFGRDVIKDSDHNGTLKIDGALLTFKQTAKDSIVYRNETYQAVKVKEGTSTSLIISSLTNSTNSVTIKNWQDNSFGIAFQAPDPQNQNPLVTGSFTGNANANVMTLNEFLKTLPAGNTKTYTQIIANGGIGTDLLQGTLNGSDTLNGGENDDFIIGGNQMYGAEFGAQLHMLDYLNLQGTDQLNGGAGSDYIVVSGKNSVAHGGTENDFIRADEYLQINVEPYEADGGVSSVDDYDVSVDNVWADLRKFLRPQFAETPTGFFLDYIDRGLTSNAWQASQSITGLNYFYLQRASNINANAIIVTTNYGDTAPSFGTRSSGEWSINGGWQTEPLSKNYLNIPNLNIADFQDLQGQHLFGDEGDDVIYGGIMSDELIGGVGDDTLFGLDGHDILDGSEGIDHLRGGTGNDTLIGGDNNDVLQGNGVTLHAAQKNLPDNDTLYGGDGNDELYGGEGKDYLDGGIGSDSLLGEEGNDYLYGGDDEVRDELIGGGNDDIMVMGTSDVAGGGSGNDIYIWNTHQVTKTPKAPASLATTNQSTSNASLADVFIDPTPAVSSIYIIDNEGSDTLALVGVQNLSDIGFDVSDNNILINTGTDQKLMIQGGASSAPMHLVTGSSVEQIVATPVTFATITDDTFLNGSDLLAQPQINTASLMLGKLQRSINVTATTAGSYLTGGLANDTLTAHIGGTRFIGGKSNDVLNGDIGNDNYLIRSGDGNDIIIEKGGINTIKLDAAITANQLTTPLVAHRNGADLLIIISSEQSITVKDMFDMNTGALVAANSIQTISFYDNTSWDITKIKQQSLISTTGDDVIGGFELNDTLKGGKGNDNLNGGAGNDVYQYALGDGNDIIVDAAGTDRIEFASSILQNQVTAFRDAYNNLVLRMVDGAKITVTGAFDAAGNFTSKNIETIQFSDGSWDAARIKLEAAKYTGNVINGTTGSDTRIGDAGKDIFTGGTGNDILSGYAGDDVYQYALGDGNDVITDIAGVDRIVFTAGITQAETKARSNGNDLILTLKDGGTVTVKDMFVIKPQTPVDPAITSIIQQLQTTWLSQAETLIENHYGLVGSGNITLNFTRDTGSLNSAQIEILPKDVNQTNNLILTINLDHFSVSPDGTGPWYYDRAIAHEMVHAAMSSNMDLTNMPGWFLEGTAEYIQGADERVKNEMDIIGNQSNFNLLFATTVGTPATSAGYSVSYIAVKLLDKEIRANGGIGIKDLFVELKTGKTLDQSLAAVSLAHSGMNGLWNNLSTFEAHFLTVGYASMNTLLNLNNADTGSIAGSDNGNASLDANAIIPNIATGPSTHFNIIIPQQFINSVGVFNEIESIQFSDGVWDAARIRAETVSAPVIGTDSNDELIGTTGNEMLIGHKSNDTLDGGSGNDIYQFEMGDGWDYITETAGTDTIQFGATISETDVSVHRYFDELRVLLSNGEYVTVKNMFDMATNEIIPAKAIEKIQFSNGNSWDLNRIRQEITKGVVLQGTSGRDNFQGFFANDILNGNAGGDILYANQGDDILNGGTGDDDMGGGLGNDLYQFALGDGSDNIYEAGGLDTIKFAPGILDGNVLLRRSEAHLIVGLSTGEKITVWWMFNAVTGATISNAAVEKIEFSNGNVWDLNRIQQEVVKPLTLQGTDGPDILVGSDLNDTLIGGKSNDSLRGLYGDDTYQINLGDGVDTIVDSGGVDSIKFGAGIFEGNVRISSRGLIVTTNTSEQRIVFDYTTIEKVEFANGNIWDAAYIQAEAIKGTAAADEIVGFNTNEAFAGGKGNDTIYGSGGDDTYLLNRGDGIDTIKDDGGISTIRFGSGIIESDVIVRYSSWGIASFYLNTGERVDFGYGASLDGDQVGSLQFANGLTWDAARIYRESIKGSSGADEIYSFRGNDTISGGAGADMINSGAGNDVINGGLGFDRLVGGAGDDTYQFARGDGVDNIKDTGGADTIQFLTGVLPTDVTLMKVDQNLFISIASSNNSIQITDEFLNGVLDPSSAIEKITFVDGTIWDATMIQQKIIESAQNPALIVGGNWSDEIHLAGTSNYLIYGMNGNDDISGGDGNDRLMGGHGINFLDGGKGNNTYFINDDGGTQIITSYANVSGQTNRVLFSDAVSKNDVQVRLAPQHEVSHIENGVLWYRNYESSTRNILLTSNNQSVYLTGHFNRSNSYAAQDFGFVEFSDGTKWDINELLRRSSTIAPPQPTAQFDTTGKYIFGVAESGSTVRVRNANGVELGVGVGVADELSGAFSITLTTALINSEIVYVTAKNTIGNISVARSINAPLIDVTPPAQPTAELDPTRKNIFGQAEAGSTVSVKNASAVELGAVVANATTGAYSITLVTALINTETVNVTAKDAAGNISAAKTIAAPLIASGDTTPPIAPTAEFNPTGKIIFGKAEAGSTVSVKNASAVELGTIVAHATTGAYSITLATALINTETVNVTAKDAAGNISIPKAIIAPDLTAPLPPTAFFNATGTTITGNAEKGSRINVYNAANVNIGNIKASTSTGNYILILTTPLTRGEVVRVAANDAAGNISPSTSTTAPLIASGDTTPPIPPTAEFDPTGKIIFGQAEAGSTVSVKNASAVELGTIVANATTGAYSITLVTALMNTETVNVTARDVAGNISVAKTITAPLIAPGDTTPPTRPTAAFDSTGKIIFGQAEAGSRVSVKNASAVELGTIVANATTGAYSITLTTALINAETVNVTAKDAAGNVSVAMPIIARDLTAPLQPTADFNTAGTIITGNAEKSSRVHVYNAANVSIGNIKASSTTGNYTITLATPLTQGETVRVIANDAAGNLSVAKTISAPVLTTATAASIKTVKMSAPSSTTAQADALIQAMAAFAPPTAAQTKTLIGYYDNSQPMLASHG